MWASMGTTSEDLTLGWATPALARFEPRLIVETLRTVVRTISVRSQSSLRQLAWHLPQLSPIYTEDEVNALRASLTSLLADNSLVRREDLFWVCLNLCNALFPHLSSAEQLGIFLSLPPGLPLFHAFQPCFGPLTTDEFEASVRSATEAGNYESQVRILFFIGPAVPPLSDTGRHFIVSAMYGEDEHLALIAANVVRRSNDRELSELAFDGARDSLYLTGSKASLYHGRAIAHAALLLDRADGAELLPPEYSQILAERFGPKVLEPLIDAIDSAIQKTTGDMVDNAPQGFEAGFDLSKNDLSKSGWVAEAAAAEEDPSVFLAELNNPDASSRKYAERHERMRRSVAAFESRLLEEGLGALIAPPVKGLSMLVQSQPDRAKRWLDTIVNANGSRLRELRNLGLVLASAYAQVDPDHASIVLEKLRDVPALMGLTIDGVELYEFAILSAPGSEQVNRLREELFVAATDDSELEALVFAAENCGASTWLTAFILRLAESTVPYDVGLGIMLHALRLVPEPEHAAFNKARSRGFLNSVVACADKIRSRDAWARHWVSSAAAAEAIDVWRYGVLAASAADRRFKAWVAELPWTNHHSCFAAELHERLQYGAQKKTKLRKKTLLGINAPNDNLMRARQQGGTQVHHHS
jgi:hypothetical protein